MNVGEFRRDCFSYQNATGPAHQSDTGGIAPGSVTLKNRAAVLGGHVTGVDDVLNAKWHTE
jgi:hypothetical protein